MADPTTLALGAGAILVTLGGNLWIVAYNSGKVRSELANVGSQVADLNKADQAKAGEITALKTQMQGWERQQERHEQLDDKRERETAAALEKVGTALEALKEHVIRAFGPLQSLQSAPKDLQALELRIAALEGKVSGLIERLTALEVREDAQEKEIRSLRDWRHEVANALNVDALRASLAAERERLKQQS